MHELGLAADILSLVEATAARERFLRVAHLSLETGALAGVEVSALRFALESISPGTCLAGASIEIKEPPGLAWCDRCSTEVSITSRAEPCPKCQQYPIRPVSGTELRVLELLVRDD